MNALGSQDGGEINKLRPSLRLTLKQKHFYWFGKNVFRCPYFLLLDLLLNNQFFSNLKFQLQVYLLAKL